MAQHLARAAIGCQPSPSGADEVLVRGGETWIVFRAVTDNDVGHLRDLGIVVVHCAGCAVARCGEPNEEGLRGHPLHALGIDNAPGSILEVMESDWAAELAAQRLESARRLWHDPPASMPAQRHFIVLFKEATFECIADELKVERYFENHAAALDYVTAHLVAAP